MPNLFVRTSALATLAATALIGTPHASAQLVTVLSQDRFIEGTTVNTAEDGSISTNGPIRDQAPAGDFGPWLDMLTVPGNITMNGNQDGGFNGTDTFMLNAFGVTLGGGGGPGTAGNSSVTNRFSFTFQVAQTAMFTLNGLIGSQPPMVLSFHLVGPGVAINDNSSAGDVSYTDRSGTLVPGTYTVTIEGTGAVTYTGPGGNGAGGGATPITLVIAAAPPTCPADFNGTNGLTVQDIFDFLAAWFSGDPRADFNHANGLGVQDIFDFLAAWFAGCP